MKFRGYHIEHRGPFGELLSVRTISHKGKFFIRNFSSKMKIHSSKASHFKFDDPFVFLNGSDDSLSLEASSKAKISLKGEDLWEGSYHGPKRISFSWTEIPESIQIKFLNNEEVIISKCDRSISSVLAPRLGAALFLGVLVFHFLGGYLTNHLTFLDLNSRHQSKEILDISKISVGLANPTYAAGRSKISAGEKRRQRARSLLNSWSVGKPLQDANQVLQPTWQQRAFSRKLDLGQTSKWSLESKNEKSLNLTDSQIAKALEPIRPYLQDCYDDVLILDSNLRGRPQLVLQVTNDPLRNRGQVENLTIENLPAKHNSLARLQKCFLLAYRRAQIPSPNQDFLVTYTLVLNH